MRRSPWMLMLALLLAILTACGGAQPAASPGAGKVTRRSATGPVSKPRCWALAARMVLPAPSSARADQA